MYPEINIDLTLDNKRIDPILEPVDLIIRIGQLADSTLIARPMSQYEMVFAASPNYLEKHGWPTSLEELTHHACLGFNYSDIHATQATGLNTPAFNKINTRLSSNNGHALKLAALAGIGVVLQPKISLATEFENQSLIEILPNITPLFRPINLLYKSKFMPLKTRTFIEFLLSEIT